jgi:cell division septum initiation protein DivIVA
MTKDHEIGILIATAAALGPDSYTGKWLQEQIPGIISAITSDLYPDAAGIRTRAQWDAEARRLINDAKNEAAKILMDAKAEADRINRFSSEQCRRWNRIKAEIDSSKRELEAAINRAYNE